MAVHTSEFPAQRIRDLKPVPGDGGWPVVGYTFAQLADPLRFLRNWYDRFGEVAWSNAFGIKIYSLIGPDANQFVFQNKGDLFSSNQGWSYFIGKFFHRGIMLLDFDEHRFHRKIMQNAFKKPVLVEYLREMNPAIRHGIDAWQPREGFEVFTAIKQLTLDLATEVFMGYELGKEADALNKAFIDTVRAGTSLIRFPLPGSRWKKGLDGRKVLVDFFRSQIDGKRGSQGMDLFSQLCRAETEDGHRFTDDDVINHMVFLMMAAHDTITSSVTSMIWLPGSKIRSIRPAMRSVRDWAEPLYGTCSSLIPVRSAKISPTRWVAVPGPTEPKLILPGWDLASATSSAVVEAGRSLRAAIRP